MDGVGGVFDDFYGEVWDRFECGAGVLFREQEVAVAENGLGAAGERLFRVAVLKPVRALVCNSIEAALWACG